MAQISNRISLSSKSRAKGKDEGENYTLPKRALVRADATHWHCMTVHDNGTKVRLYPNVNKEPTDMIDRIVSALAADDPTFTRETWEALPQVMRDRTMRDIDVKTSPVPTTFMPKEYTDMQAATYMEYDGSTTPRLVNVPETLDVATFSALADIAQDVHEKATAFSSQHVPMPLILESFGVLNLRPVTVKDKDNENAAKITHYAAEYARGDATKLTATILAAQKIGKERAANAAKNGNGTTNASAPAEGTTEQQPATAKK